MAAVHRQLRCLVFAVLPRLGLVCLRWASRNYPLVGALRWVGRLAEEVGVVRSCLPVGQAAAWGVQCACLEGPGKQLRECRQAGVGAKHTQCIRASGHWKPTCRQCAMGSGVITVHVRRAVLSDHQSRLQA